MAADISTLQVNVVSNGVKETAKGLDNLAKAADRAETSTKKLGTAVLALDRDLAGSQGASLALTRAILGLNSTISLMGGSLNANTRAHRINNDAMRDAHQAARGLTGSLGMLWLTYGSLIPMAVGAAIGASFKQMVTQGMELENTLVGIGVKGAETVETMQRAKAAILDLGQGIYGPQQVAGALETLVLAGLNAEKALVALAPALNLATVGGTTIEKSAYTLVQVGTAMGYTADNFSLVADKIAKTAAVSMSSVESLSEAFKSASSVGVVYGITLDNLGASLAALSNLGIQGTAAGTAVKNFYKELESDMKRVGGTMEKLGLKMDDLKFEGKFKDVGQVMALLSEAFDKAGDKAGKAMQNMSNERGMRAMAALLQLYRQQVGDTGNALDDLNNQIANSAGYAAVSAARIALSSKNQVESTLNTLKVAFVKAFDEMAPQVTVVSNELKKVFASEEFKVGLQGVATTMAGLIRTLVESIPTIVEFGKAFLVIKTGLVAHAALVGMAKGLYALEAAFIASSSAALGLSAVLPVIGGVLAVAAAAWWMYTKNKEAGLDTSKVDQAIATNEQLIQSLEKEANRLAVENEHLAKNTSLKQAAANATRELAESEMHARNKSAEADAEKQFRSVEKAALASNDPTLKRLGIKGLAAKGIETLDSDVAKAVRAYKNWQNAVSNTVNSEADLALQMGLVEERSREKQRLTDQRMKQDAEAERLRQQIAAGLAGNPDISGGKGDAGAKRKAEFLASERLELEKQLETYKARTEAVLQGANTEKRVMAEVEVARVDANMKADKYASASAYSAQRALAAQVDMAKFEQQKANAITEQLNKLSEIANREKAYQAEVATGSTLQMGKLEKQTISIMRFNSASEQSIEIERRRARAADETIKIEDARKRLASATGAGNQRADSMSDEALAITLYGSSAKQSAVEAANLLVVRTGLTQANSAAVIQELMLAAANEDSARSYLELTKQLDSLERQEAKNRAVSVEGVIGAETAKVQAMYNTTKKAIAFDVARAESAYKTATSSGDVGQIGKAMVDLAAVQQKATEVKAILDKSFKLDIKVAGLKDVGSMLDSMTHAADGLGKSFEGVADALAGLTQSFTSLAEIQAREGISEEERNAAKIGAYGDMASASASFFSENSRGYQTMMGISKVFHAAEMAMTMWRLGKLAIEAVMTQAKGDPYTAWGRMAAMAAVVGTLGFAVGGGFNGGSGGKKAEDVQKKQGAGTVFGDAEAKSNTITKSMEMLKSNSDFMLPLTEAMKNSLSSIEASMTGLSNLVLRSDGVQSGKNFDIATGVIGKSLGGLWGKTKQNIVDAGIAIKGSVAGLQAGQGYNQYASVDTTKSSFFGLKKKTTNKVETQGLDSELSSQFALIFTKLEDSLALVGPTFGKTADQVSSAIDNLTIDASVSLKDLKGEDLEKALNGVISKAMDQIAETAFPAMGAFRQVGEGYAQTVIRVASGIEQSSVALEAFGIKSISFSEMANKTGDIAFELTKQSIGLFEAGSGVGKLIETFTGSLGDLTKSYQQLVDIRKIMTEVGLGANLNAATIKGAGGSTQLNTALETYYDKFFEDDEKIRIETAKMTGLFSKLGMALPDSREQLRTWVETAASTGDQLQVGQLLALAGGFDELATMIEKIGKAAEEAAAKIDPYQNEYFLSEYFTAFERIGIETTKVTKGFGELNLAMPGSRDELRKWVLAAHEAGDDKTVGKLLALTETFGGLLKMIDDFKVNPLKDSNYLSAYYSAVEQVSIMTQHMTEDFGKLGYALPDSREQLRAWMDAAVAAGDQTTVNKLLELSSAFTTLTDAVMDVKISDIADLEKTAKDALSGAESAFDTVKRMIEKEKKTVNETISTAKDAISGLKTVLQEIDEAIKSTAPNVTKAEQFADAMQTVNDALMKVRGGAKLQDIKGLNDAYESLGSDDTSEYSTLFDFQRDQAHANALLKELQEAGKGQLTEAEKALATAETQLKVLETQLEMAESQLNALKGIDESVMSVEAALGKFADAVLKAVAANAALAAGKTDGGVSAQVESLYKNLLGRDSDAEGKKFWVDAVNGGQSLGNVAQGFTGSDEYKAKGVTSQLESLYSGLLGRPSDAAGLKYWTDALNSGTSISQITKDFLDSEEYKKKSKIPSFAIGTNEVPEDMLANIHKGERIIPAADNAELMRRLDEDGNPKTSDTGNNAQFEELKQIIQSGDIAKVQKIAELFKIIREWDNTGIPGERNTEE